MGQIYELKDSLYEAQKHKEIMELQNHYETQKKEAEILELRKKEQRESYLRSVLIISLVGFIVISILFSFWINQKRVRVRQKASLLEKENQIKSDQMEKLSLKNQLQEESAKRYELDMQMKEQELIYQTLKRADIEKTNQSVKEKLTPFIYRFNRKKDQNEFSNTLNEISLEVDRDPLSDFEQMFMQMHDKFYEKLLEINADLSRSELQMCAFLCLNLPSKEIADLLNLSLSTIDHRRHSIRKKLGLESTENLISYLICI